MQRPTVSVFLDDDGIFCRGDGATVMNTLSFEVYNDSRPASGLTGTYRTYVAHLARPLATRFRVNNFRFHSSHIKPYCYFDNNISWCLWIIYGRSSSGSRSARAIQVVHCTHQSIAQCCKRKLIVRCSCENFKQFLHSVPLPVDLCPSSCSKSSSTSSPINAPCTPSCSFTPFNMHANWVTNFLN